MERKKILIAAGIVIVAIVIISVLNSQERSYYIEAVRSMRPLESEGINASYDMVISRYITPSRWKARLGSSGLGYVDVRGRINDNNGTAIDVMLTFRVTRVEEGRYDLVYIEPFLLELDGRFYQQGAAIEFVQNLFYTHIRD